MAGVEEVRRTAGVTGVVGAAGKASNDDYGKFKFIRYERSSDAVDVRDSSVSYVSGFAVL